MHVRLLLLATGLLVVGSGAQAALPGVYVTTSTGVVARVDLRTGALSNVFNAGVALTDIAASRTGDVYATTFNSLYRLDLDAGTATFVGDHGVYGMNALAFDKAGNLYGHGDRDDRLLRLNLSTGAATGVGRTGLVSDGDLAFVGDSLFMTTRASGNSGLVRLDPATGNVLQFIGNTGLDRAFGLAVIGGALFEAARDSTFSIDLTHGIGTLRATIAAPPPGLGELWGATFLTPVPLPAVLFCTALAGLGLLSRRRRRRE